MNISGRLALFLLLFIAPSSQADGTRRGFEEASYAPRVRAFIERIDAVSHLEYSARLPELEAQASIGTPQEQAEKSCHLAAFGMIDVASYSPDHVNRCRELASAVGDESLVRLATIFGVMIRYPTMFSASKEALHGWVDVEALEEDLHARAFYLIATREPDITLTRELWSVSRELEDRGREEDIVFQYLMMVRGLAADEDLDRILEHLDVVLDFAQQHQFPLHRYNLLYNLVIPVDWLYSFTNVCLEMAEAYLMLARKEGNRIEERWGHHLKLICASSSNDFERVLSVVEAGRAMNLQLPSAYEVELGRHEAYGLIGLGYSAEARSLLEGLLPLASKVEGADEREVRSLLASVEVLDGDPLSAIELLHQFYMSDSRYFEMERVADLMAVRHMVESESASRNEAQRAVLRLQRSNLLLLLAGVAITTFTLYLLHLSRRLRAAKIEADTASNAKSRFVADMSHEIRTPMNAILGYADALRRSDHLWPEQYQQIEAISYAGNHLQGLIDDVLDMSKIEADRMELEIENVELYGLLESLVDLFRLQANEKRVALHLVVDDEVPSSCKTDGGKFRQIVINLVGNAVKFTVGGCVDVRLDAVLQPAGRCLLRFTVKDTGPGIAADEEHKVFTQFEQTSSGRKSGGGTGLGLALSRDYARLMGGDITFASVEGVGSEFVFEVPVSLQDGQTANP